MMLWTIQTAPAWESLQKRGYLRAQRIHADRDFLSAYDWLACQMRDRIGEPPTRRVSVPIWAWQQFDGIKKRRPDIRRSRHLPSGTRGYRICFTIPDDQVLLSDFELWHYALNYWYLPSSESDDQAFRECHRNLRCSWQDPPTDKAINSAIQRSWQRMFDLDWHDPYIAAPREQKSIQATFWHLDYAWVTSVDAFVAR